MKRRISKIMAYVCMPLFFTVFGYLFVYIAAAPVLEMLQAVGSMVVAKEIPSFHSELASIYDAASNEAQAQVESGNIAVEDIEFPDNGTHYGKIACDRIELEAPVYWGDSNTILKAGVGHFMGSFMPGYGKSILLSGHNTTYFKPLKYIKTGDVLTYNTNYGVFEYQVAEVKIINLSEIDSATRNEMLSYQEETLILYTCYPFETLVGTKTDRLFVFAEKLSGPTVE